MPVGSSSSVGRERYFYHLPMPAPFLDELFAFYFISRMSRARRYLFFYTHGDDAADMITRRLFTLFTFLPPRRVEIFSRKHNDIVYYYCFDDEPRCHFTINLFYRPRAAFHQGIWWLRMSFRLATAFHYIFSTPCPSIYRPVPRPRIGSEPFTFYRSSRHCMLSKSAAEAFIGGFRRHDY